MVITLYSSITTSLLVLTDSVRVPFPRFSSLALVPVSFVIRCYPAGSPYCHFLPLSNTRQGRFRCKNAPVRGKRKEERARKEGKRKGRPVDLQQLCILSCTHTRTHTHTTQTLCPLPPPLRARCILPRCYRGCTTVVSRPSLPRPLISPRASFPTQRPCQLQTKTLQQPLRPLVVTFLYPVQHLPVIRSGDLPKLELLVHQVDTVILGRLYNIRILGELCRQLLRECLVDLMPLEVQSLLLRDPVDWVVVWLLVLLEGEWGMVHRAPMLSMKLFTRLQRNGLRRWIT